MLILPPRRIRTRAEAWAIRYYQQNAVENALKAIATGRKRILLTLATGTGKTSIAFQISWKLFQTRWNLSGEPNRLPRPLARRQQNGPCRHSEPIIDPRVIVALGSTLSTIRSKCEAHITNSCEGQGDSPVR
jgi:hypothetical protein